jgi:hypothetical protein
MTQMRRGGYNAGGHACIVAPAIWPRLLQRHKTAGMCNAEPIQARKIWFFQAPRLAMLLPLYALVVLIWGSTWIAQDAAGQRTRELSIAYRFGLASLVLFAWLLLTRQWRVPAARHSTRAGPGTMPVQPELCLLHARQRDPDQRSGCRGVFQCQHLECISGESSMVAAACAQCSQAALWA